MNVATVRILLVEDSSSDADKMQATLRQASGEEFLSTWVTGLEEAFARLRVEAYDVLLLDLSLPDSTGLETLRQMRRNAPRLPMVLLTSAQDEALGLAALREGGQDYLVKDQTDSRQMARAIRYAIERARAEEALRQQATVLAGINQIFTEAIRSRTEEELGKTCLTVAAAVTESQIAFMGELGEDGLLRDIAISDPGWERCTMSKPTGHRRPARNFKVQGLYGRVLRDGESFFTNDPANHPESTGTPAGHPPLHTFLGVPLFHDGRTMGLIAVANRQGGYSLAEQSMLEALAPAMVEALVRKRAEEAVQQAKEQLEQKVKHRTAELAVMVRTLQAEVEQRQQAEQHIRVANEQLQTRAHQLRALTGELTLAEQRERRRIAKLLHDHLQQMLAGAKFHLSALARHQDESAQQAIQVVQDLLSKSISVSRSLTVELSPPILLEGDLAAGLHWLARWMEDKHGLKVELNLEKAPPLVDDLKIFLFESVRELLFNVVQHAQVLCATVTLRSIRDEAIHITVGDAGRGFEFQQQKWARETGGWGLFGIRERVELLGGRFEIQSTVGQGSQLELIVPINSKP